MRVDSQQQILGDPVISDHNPKSEQQPQRRNARKPNVNEQHPVYVLVVVGVGSLLPFEQLVDVLLGVGVLLFREMSDVIPPQAAE